MMTLFDTSDGVDGEIGRRKHILPGELTVSIWVFSFQGIEKIDSTVTLREVEFMLCFHPAHLLVTPTVGRFLSIVRKST